MLSRCPHSDPRTSKQDLRSRLLQFLKFEFLTSALMRSLITLHSKGLTKGMDFRIVNQKIHELRHPVALVQTAKEEIMHQSIPAVPIPPGQ